MLKINQMNLNAKNYSECDYTYKLISSNFLIFEFLQVYLQVVIFSFNLILFLKTLKFFLLHIQISFYIIYIIFIGIAIFYNL